jgi:hypothetical protein
MKGPTVWGNGTGRRNEEEKRTKKRNGESKKEGRRLEKTIGGSNGMEGRTRRRGEEERRTEKRGVQRDGGNGIGRRGED